MFKLKKDSVKILIITVILLLIGFLGFSQDKKISQLPALPSISGNEQIPLAKSGSNYYLTPSQLSSWLNIVGYVPLVGTSGTNYITGTLQYEPVSPLTTAFVSTTQDWAQGVGNATDLMNTATNYGRTQYAYGNTIITTGYDGTNYGAINIAPNNVFLQTTNSGSTNTKLAFTFSTSILSANSATYKGLEYSSATGSLVTANQYSLSILHRAANDARYAPITGGAYLSSTLASGKVYIGNASNVGTATVISGDATLANTGALTLATVNSNVGSFGSASTTNSITVNAKGLTTAVSTVAIQIPESQVTNLTTDLAGKQASLSGTGYVKASGTSISYDNSTYLTGNQTITLSGDVTGSGATSITTSLSTTGVSAGTYTLSTITVDNKGRISSASSGTVSSGSNPVAGTNITVTGTSTVNLASTVSNTTFDSTNSFPIASVQPIYRKQWRGTPYTGAWTSGASNQGFIWFSPYLITKTHQVSDIGSNILVAVAGGTVQYALYNDSSGYPTTLITQTGTITCTTTGLHSYTFGTPILLNASSQTVWMAVQYSSATIAVPFTNNQALVVRPDPTVNNSNWNFDQSITYGNFPARTGTAGGGNALNNVTGVVLEYLKPR